MSTTDNRRRVRKMAASSSSGDGGSGAPTFKKKKQRQPSDESLFGKTGVSALYEWCGKRRTTPTFTLEKHTTSDDDNGDDDHDEDTTNDSDAAAAAAEEEENGDDDDGKRRRLYLLVEEDFEMTVSIDGMEWGRGRGRTKSAAKQEAARRALQVLLPGVVFDDASGILVQLPTTTTTTTTTTAHAPVHHSNTNTTPTMPSTTTTTPPSSWNNKAATTTAASLEDLAPNLAKRLAIGHTNDDDDNDDDVEKVATGCGEPKAPKSSSTTVVTRSTVVDASKKRQNWPHLYSPGGTTTTSDEEDENAYYASRGASVCSALLHAMVQIDERIPEAPVYTYQVSTVPPGNGTGMDKNNSIYSSQLKRKAGGPFLATTTTTSIASSSPPIVVHRGSFTCTATMRLHTRGSMMVCCDVLQAVGVGGTKREARHTASAKLLALLFPECNGMVQVKQAAEAAREEYAASKALKQQSKRERAFTSKSHRNRTANEPPSLTFAMASGESPTIPMEREQHLLMALGAARRKPLQHNNEHNDEDKDKERKMPARDESGMARQLSRQKQLDDRIAAALQKLNEHDEEGRSLPDELTVDDVGRTVLRRASPEDMHWIAKLLDTKRSGDEYGYVPSLSPVSVLGPTTKDGGIGEDDDDVAGNELPSVALRLWSSSTIVLLLCRVIAPYEDPPLGCAVLTLGFSMEKGRLLRIAQIASKPHLPRERFIECLQSFASCMCYALETTSAIKSTFTTLRQGEIQEILNSHLPLANRILCSLSSQKAKVMPRPRAEPLVTSPLQSVQEESEGVEESGDSCPESLAEERFAKKEPDKPSKRSRVQ
jgi:hypothetical protein